MKIKRFQRIKYRRKGNNTKSKRNVYNWVVIFISFSALIVALIALFKTIEGTKISNRPFIVIEKPMRYSIKY